MPISASAARAASPPLSCSSTRARAQACASVSTVRMPLPIGKASRDRKIHQAARGLLRHDLEMDGLAADHAAERDGAVIGLALRLRAVERDRDRGRNFERARHGDEVDLGAGLLAAP